jgi:hypothetical protein
MSALDDYLERLGAQLQTSPEEAAEVLREVRSHLELAVRDMGRNGNDHALCLARAMERFGTAEHVGQQLRQVHGRATWREIALAALPLLLLGWLTHVVQLPVWVVPLLLATVTVAAWRMRWPLWWWAWLGWLPFAIPGAPRDLVWGAVAYGLILLLITRRDWLEATLAIYPLLTAWAFFRVVLTSFEVRHVGWSAAAFHLLGLGMALVWVALLARTLRTPSGTARIVRVLEGQVTIFLLNGLVVTVARLWPTYPYPYPFTWRYFLSVTVPYAIYHGLPFLLFFVLTSLPAILALVQRIRARRPPPTRTA